MNDAIPKARTASTPGACVRLLVPRLTAQARVQALRDCLERVATTMDIIEPLCPEDSNELWSIVTDLSEHVRMVLGDDAVLAECPGPRLIARSLRETSEALVEADRLMLAGEVKAP